MKTVFILMIVGMILIFVPRFIGVRPVEEEYSQDSMASLAKEALVHLTELEAILDDVNEIDEEITMLVNEPLSKMRYKLSVVYGYYLAVKHHKQYEDDLMAFALLSAALFRLGYIMIRKKRVNVQANQ